MNVATILQAVAGIGVKTFRKKNKNVKNVKT